MPALVTGSSPSPPTPRKLLRWTSFPAQLFINCKLGGGLTGPIANRTFTHQHSRRHFWQSFQLRAAWPLPVAGLRRAFLLRCTPPGDTMAAVKALFNLKVLFFALLALIFIGVAGSHFIEGWPWFDGFYMVLTTITTIGYGEIHPLSHRGRIFNTFIIVTGVGLVLLFFGAATQALLEFELQSIFGRRRMEREISRLSDHYIISLIHI